MLVKIAGAGDAGDESAQMITIATPEATDVVPVAAIPF